MNGMLATVLETSARPVRSSMKKQKPPMRELAIFGDENTGFFYTIFESGREIYTSGTFTERESALNLGLSDMDTFHEVHPVRNEFNEFGDE